MAAVSFRASARLAQAALDALPQHIAVLDQQGAVVAVNTAWRRFAAANGLADPDAAVGANYLEVCARAALAGDTVAALAGAGIKDVLAGRLPTFSLDYPCHSPTEQRWFTLHARCLEGDNPRHIVVSHDDVTERTLSVQALRASETRLRAVVDTAPDGILTIDEQGVVTSANPAAERLFGYPVGQLLGSHADRLMPDIVRRTPLVADKAAQHSDSRALLAHNSVLGGYGVRHDGSRFPMELTCSEIELDGWRQFTCLVHDLTRRRQADEQIARGFHRLTALRHIDMAISGSLNLRLILEIVLDETCRHLGVDAAAVLLLNAPSYTLEYCVGQGFQSKLIRQTALRLGEGTAGQVALERRTLSLADWRNSNQSIVRVELFDTEGFVAYCAVPLLAKGQVRGVLELFHRTPLQTTADWLSFAEALAGQAAIAIDNTTLFEDLQRSNAELALAYDDTIEGWSRALDLHDKETEGHSRRVTDMTLALAPVLGIREADLVHVRRGALLHDIGNMGIPDGILLKRGPLSKEEWAVVRRHPIYAVEMLSPIQYLRPALQIPYCHHEKWDGTGYPRGLQGEQIPREARMFAVADVYDALSSDRPYRAAWPRERALSYIAAQAGSHFDPTVVAAFLQMFGGETSRQTS